MKKFLTILLASISLYANELFLYDFTDKIELNEVIDNKLKDANSQSGKTYSLLNNLSLGTSTNSTATYTFAHRIAVHQKEQSTAYFSQSQTEYVNDFKLPAVVKVKDSLFTFSFNGELYCVSTGTNKHTISTSMSFIIFDTVQMFVKAGDKYTQVYIVDGTATVQDSKSKKKKDLKTGDYLVITPQVILNPKEGTITKLGNSFSIKEVEDDEKQIHNKEINVLQEKLNNSLFVNYGTNVFGIKLK